MKFDTKVWNLLKKIPKGRVTTYGLIAKKLKTRGYRAIGNACRRNLHTSKVPCHRVVRSNGTVGGFKGRTSGKALDDKIRLLKNEKIRVRNGKIMDFEKVLFKF